MPFEIPIKAFSHPESVSVAWSLDESLPNSIGFELSRVMGDPHAALNNNYLITGLRAMADRLNADRETARRFVDVTHQATKWPCRHAKSAVIQPVLDYSTRYVGLKKTSATSLIWRA
jgi:hypothetical protein